MERQLSALRHKMLLVGLNLADPKLAVRSWDEEDVLSSEQQQAIHCRLFSAAQAFEMLNLIVQSYVTLQVSCSAPRCHHRAM